MKWFHTSADFFLFFFYYFLFIFRFTCVYKNRTCVILSLCNGYRDAGGSREQLKWQKKEDTEDVTFSPLGRVAVSWPAWTHDLTVPRTGWRAAITRTGVTLKNILGQRKLQNKQTNRSLMDKLKSRVLALEPNWILWLAVPYRYFLFVLLMEVVDLMFETMVAECLCGN